MSADASPVQYEVVHTTEYDYSESVAVSHHLARLEPSCPAASAASCTTSCRSSRRPP